MSTRFFRAFTAKVQQEILNAGKDDTGIITAEGFDYEIIEKQYWPHDNLGIAVTLKADGTIEKDVIGSIVEFVTLNSENEQQWGRLLEIFTSPSLQMVSFTITEKGYSLVNAKGEFHPDVLADFANGSEKPKSYIGKVAGLLYITGNLCDKGKEYVTQELTAPKRTVTSSVSVKNGELPLASVRTSAPIPKERIFDAMKEIRGISLEAPVEAGQVVIADLLGCGCDVIITKTVERI